MIAEEPRHVLDDADHLEVDLARHVRGALRDLLRGGLRSGDDHDLGARQELRHRQRDVAGAGRHVDDEVIGLAPVHVSEELLERLVQHRAAPYDRLVLTCKEAHRDERDAVGVGRHDHVVDDGGRPVDAEHARHREAPHVGVDGGDLVAALRERDREVGGNRRLADATLARRDREHAGAGVDERVGPVLVAAVALVRLGGAAAVQPGCHGGALLVGHHGEVDVDPADAGQRAHGVGDAPRDLGPQRAARDRERDGHADAVALDRDRAHHVEIDDRLVDLGVLDGPQRIEHLGLCGHRGCSWELPLPT